MSRRCAVASGSRWTVQSPEIRELFAKGGFEASGISPAEMAREAKSLADRWGAVARDVGVRLEP
jgi:hypothetical protein